MNAAGWFESMSNDADRAPARTPEDVRTALHIGLLMGFVCGLFSSAMMALFIFTP